MQMSLLQRIALFARHRYRTVFVAFAILLALSLALILRLQFNTDMLSLLPQEDPAVRTYVETLQDFGSSTFLLVAIRIPEGSVVDPYETLADRLAARLSRLPDLKSVQHRVGDPQELLQTFYPKALLFLDEAGRRKLEERLSDEGIRNHVSEVRRQIATPQGLAAKEILRIDPLGLADVFLGRLQSSRGSLRVDWTSGYYLSGDHSLLLILAEPVRPPQDIAFAEQLADKIDRIVAEETGRWKEIAGGMKAPQVVVGGPHLTALGDAALIRRDMVLNLGTVVPSVLLFFWFTFRRPGTLMYAMFPLLTGLLLTFGFAEIAVGSLSSATSGVAALLVGLGIDFVIVSYGRYIEERQKGAGLEDALRAMMGSNGRAVLVGAVTTTVTFWAFTFTKFTGLREMGLLTGTGILFCVGSVFLLLPAMLAWSEDHHTRRQKQPTLFLHSFGSEGLMRAALHHPRPTLLAALVVTLVSLSLLVDIEFDESMKTMRPKGNRGIAVAEEVGQKFGSGFDSMSVILTGDSPEEIIELSGEAAKRAQRLVQTGTLYGYSGVTSLIPPPTQQREALAWIERERNGGGALDLERIRATFARAAAEEGLRPEGFAPGLGLLAQAVSLDSTVGYESFQTTPQTRLLLERYLRKTDRGWKGAVYLYPPDNRWRREPPPDAVRLAQELGPKAALSGTNVINQRVRALVLRDAWIACVLGTVLVALLIWMDFRSLSRTLAALAPLTVGLIWMGGGMVAFDTPMNFINIFVTTMIIGIGVDYGVHILHRFQEVQDFPREKFEQGIVETGKAVVAASVSTVFGFGSMMFSSYPGLVSTGKVAVLGAVSTCLVAITLVPAVLRWRYDQRRARGIPTNAG